MKIFNGTQHQINIYQLNQCDNSDPRKIIVKKGEEPVFTIPAGDASETLNCTKGNLEAPNIDDCPVPLKGAVVFHSVDPLPDGYDLYICSNLYRSACKDLGYITSKLATVGSVVYLDKDNPRPCGCLELNVG